MKISEIKELAEKEIKRFDALAIQRLKTEAIKTNNPTLHARKHQLAEACLKLCEHIGAMNAVVKTKMPQQMIENGWDASLDFLGLEIE